METISMDLQKSVNMYNRKTSYDFTDFMTFNTAMANINNRLLATFTNIEGIDELVEYISATHNIIYKKIFILQILQSDEFVLTYNIEQGNADSIPNDTILLHRKKQSNTLYTINALNELIKKLNGGVVDTSYKIDWQHYRNCILLTQHNELKQLNTKIHRIIELE